MPSCSAVDGHLTIETAVISEAVAPRTADWPTLVDARTQQLGGFAYTPALPKPVPPQRGAPGAEQEHAHRLGRGLATGPRDQLVG
jgi:hypothetical protein